MAIDFTWFDHLPRQPKPDQRKAVEFLLHTNRSVLADGTGLGKTACSLFSYAYYARGKTPQPKLLFLAKKTSAFKIGDEVRKALAREALVVSGDETEKVRLETYRAWGADHPILITTHPRAIRDYLDLASMATPEIDVLIADEAHGFKTVYPQPTQSHEALRTLQKRFRVVWALTATPFSNSPLEAYGILSALDPAYGGDLFAFLNRYCDWKLVERPQPRINIKAIRDRSYYLWVYNRLLTRETNEEMPNVHFLPMTMDLKPQQIGPYRKMRAGFDYLKSQGVNAGSREVLMLEKVVSAPPLVDVDCLSPKADWLKKWLETNPGKKIVAFTSFVDILHWYREWVESLGYRTVFVTGEVSDAQDRYDVVKAFNTDPGIRVIFINRAGSDSIDLDGAADLVFIGLPFSAIDHQQTMGRIRRLSSLFDDVRIHVPIVGGAGSIDDIKYKVLMKKLRLEAGARSQAGLSLKLLAKRVAAREAKTGSSGAGMPPPPESAGEPPSPASAGS